MAILAGFAERRPFQRLWSVEGVRLCRGSCATEHGLPSPCAKQAFLPVLFIWQYSRLKARWAHRQACLCSVRFGRARLRRAKEQSGRRGRGWAVTKETALLDDLRHFRRHHFLPTAVTSLQFGERVRRENLEVLRMIIGDFGDEIVIHDELEKRL